MKTLITLFFSLALISCKTRSDKSPENLFKVPYISQIKSNDTIEYFSANFISFSRARFLGKSKLCDSLHIPRPRMGTNLHSIDYIQEGIVKTSDIIMSDGFELFPDYLGSIAHVEYNEKRGNYFYPVYIVNQTPQTKVIIGKDDYVFAIQEALDEHRIWRPIEGKGFDFCGNGYWGLKIHPKEFFTVLMPKYKGSFKTKLRVRIKIGEIIYVSQSFNGEINKAQFYLNKNKDGFDNYLYKQLIDYKFSAVQGLFYGAVPREMDEQTKGL